MRIGPDYRMHGPEVRDNDDGLWLRVPLELSHEWSEYKSINWHENYDGTILLTPSKDF
jgi:hypothetical protein